MMNYGCPQNVTGVHITHFICICKSAPRMGGAAAWAGPPKILVGWATMHLAPAIIGLYVR